MNVESRLEHLERELKDLRREVKNDRFRFGKYFCRSSIF